MLEKKVMLDREFQDWWSQMGWPHRMSFSLDDLDFEDVEILDESPGEPIEAPLLPMRDMVMFPRMVAPLLVRSG